TQGSWKGVYGVDCYSVIADTTTYPAYASFSHADDAMPIFYVPGVQTCALPIFNSSTDRIAAAYYSATSFTYDLNLTDAQTHQVRSEERRVGKECRSRRAPYHDEENNDLIDAKQAS